MYFTDVSGMGDLPERNFLLRISDDMVSVAPKIMNLRFGRFRKMDQDTQPSIRISFGSLSFVKAVFGNRGFKIVLSHLRHNGQESMTRCFREMIFSSRSFWTKRMWTF